MSQIGVIVVSDSINVSKFIELAKADPKITIGKEEVSQDGTKYIPLNKSWNFMSAWLIVFTGLVYAYIAIEQGLKGNTGMLIAYLGYAFANIGLYMLASK